MNTTKLCVQVEEEIRRVGMIGAAEDVDAILPVLSGWFAALHNAAPTPDKQQQQHHQQGVDASRPRWRQPPLVVWNALCALLPLLAAPAVVHAAEEIQDLVTTIVTAATDSSQYQCAPCCRKLRHSQPSARPPTYVKESWCMLIAA